MAESRRQLIEGSSFLRNEKEKIGGLNVKRSTISGDAFKKGTSQESAENIDKRVGNNERKITLLKNIFKARKDNVDQKVGAQISLQGILQSIAESVDSIRDTLIKRQESGEEGAEGRRVRAEQAEFDAREKDLEKKKRFEGLKKIGGKVLAPVRSLWERIWNFIKTIFLGKILLNFLQWIANPANQQKIRSFIRFVKDWWPALLAAVLLFGTGFGAMITNLTVAISLWIPKMLGAIKALGVMALAGGARTLNFGRKAFSAFGRTRRFNDGGIVPGSGNSDTVPAMLTPGEVVMSKDAVQQYGADTLLDMNAAAGGNNKPSFSGGRGGGKKIGGLPGLGGGGGGTNSLTEQAKVKTFGGALKDILFGENRMTDLEKSQRMAGGGLVQYFNNGGEVKNYENYWEWKNEFEKGKRDAHDRLDPRKGTKEGDQILREISRTSPSKRTQQNIYDYIALGGNDRKTEFYVKQLKHRKKYEFGMGDKIVRLTTDPGERTPPKLDRVTGDPGERTPPKLDRGGRGGPVLKGQGGRALGSTTQRGGGEKAKKAAENISKPSGTGGGESSVQVIKAGQNQQNPEQGQDGGGDEIPAFEVGTTRDLAKVRTLGIMVM